MKWSYTGFEALEADASEKSNGNGNGSNVNKEKDSHMKRINLMKDNWNIKTAEEVKG